MERLMPATPDDLGMALLRETRDLARALDRTLRGHNGHVGLVAKVDALEKWVRQREKEVEDQHLIKMVRSDTEQVKWKTYGIVAGATGGALTFLYEIFKFVTGIGG